MINRDRRFMSFETKFESLKRRLQPFRQAGIEYQRPEANCGVPVFGAPLEVRIQHTRVQPVGVGNASLPPLSVKFAAHGL